MRALIAVSLMLIPTHAFAAPPASTKTNGQPEKKICKIDPEETESRIRRRVCKTESEWNGSGREKGEPQNNGSSR